MKILKGGIFPEKFGYMPYLWLVYVAMPIYYLVISHLSLPKTCFGYFLLALFLLVYRQSYWVDDRKAKLCVLAEIAIITILGVFYSSDMLFLSSFPATLFGYVKRVRNMLLAIYGMMAFYMIALTISDPHEARYFLQQNMLMFVLTNTALPFGVRYFSKYIRMNAQLSEANEQIARLTKETERQRIARDLHDILGHTLSMITLKSELAEKLVTRNPERAIHELKDVQSASRGALQQVRELISNMHTVSLKEEIEHARQFLAAAKIELTLIGNPDDLQVSHLRNTILAMCMREAITNIVRHSRAKNCRVELSTTKATYQLKVVDDGIGLPPHIRDNGGHGLYGMQQRLEIVGGTLQWQSEPGQGTQICLSIPIIVSGTKEELSS